MGQLITFSVQLTSNEIKSQWDMTIALEGACDVFYVADCSLEQHVG